MPLLVRRVLWRFRTRALVNSPQMVNRKTLLRPEQKLMVVLLGSKLPACCSAGYWASP